MIPRISYASSRILKMPAVMADAFLSMVSTAPITLPCVMGEPVDLAHKASSSIAAASACWLCSRRVNTSAVAILAWLLSVMTIVLVGYKDRSSDATE